MSSMKKFIRFMIIPVICALVISVYFYFSEDISLKANEANVNFILEHMNSNGVIIDYYEEISVDSVEDIRLFVEGEKVKIDFGKITMKWYLKDFVSPENQELLGKIGIRMFKDKETGRLRVFWGEDEIERWVS